MSDRKTYADLLSDFLSEAVREFWLGKARECLIAAYSGHLDKDGTIFRDADPNIGLRALTKFAAAKEKP
jgi:hypothetical protein